MSELLMANPTDFGPEKLLEIWREKDDRFDLIEEGDWSDEGKFSSQEVIFKDILTGKHYAFGVTRSGSYFSDYFYEVWDTATEVQKIIRPITIESWEIVQ